MIKQEKYTEFLNKLADISANKISPSYSANTINKILKTYLDIENTEFIIRDSNGMLLKNFVDNMITYEDTDGSGTVNIAYMKLSANNGTKFYFNDEEFDFNLDETEQYRLIELKSDENIIILPMISNGEVFGMIKILTEKTAFTKDFFLLLNIASKMISGAIINYLLNEQMDISLNFYKAMKDIAKIIESQYELSYIIPLIGEMIDRFMPSHLVYIFIYRDGKYELMWPVACKDKNVYEILEKITPKTECIMSNDSKIGAFPLLNEDNILGAVVAYSNIEKLYQKDIDYLIQLTKQSGLTIQRANSYAEILKYATMDALTGLNNRRQFELRLKQEVSNSKRNNVPLCCMMLDADYFKKVNDTYGHAAGDMVLKTVSQIIQNEIREYDIACRYGGEEFFIILPQTKIKEAVSVAKRLRKTVENTRMDLEETSSTGERYINITVSVGVCEYKSETPEELIQKADRALYDAKESGRNRVITAE